MFDTQNLLFCSYTSNCWNKHKSYLIDILKHSCLLYAFKQTRLEDFAAKIGKTSNNTIKFTILTLIKVVIDTASNEELIMATMPIASKFDA